MRALDRRSAFAVAVAALALTPVGCGWLDKTVDCHELTQLSNRWSQKADVFGRQLETDVEQQLESLERLEMDSRAAFVRASHDLQGASDTLDGRVNHFFGEITEHFQALHLTDPQVVAYRERYIEQVEEVGARIQELTATLRYLGDLFAHIDPSRITTEYQARRFEQQMTDVVARITAAERRLEESTEAEEELIDQINAYCQPLVPPRPSASS